MGADDKMVQQADVAGFDVHAQLAVEGDVGLAVFGHATGLVVKNDQRGGVGAASSAGFPADSPPYHKMPQLETLRPR